MRFVKGLMRFYRLASGDLDIHNRWGRSYLWINLDSRNRLSASVDTEYRKWVALSWGNGYSDPVWMIEVGLPRWIWHPEARQEAEDA